MVCQASPFHVTHCAPQPPTFPSAPRKQRVTKKRASGAPGETQLEAVFLAIRPDHSDSPSDPAGSSSRSSMKMAMESVEGIAAAISMDFSEVHKSSALVVEPALQRLLRSMDVAREVLMGLCCQQILTRSLFVALDSSKESLEDVCNEALGVDVSKGKSHKREMTKIIGVKAKNRLT